MGKLILQGLFVLLMLPASLSTSAQTHSVPPKFNKQEIENYIKAEMKAEWIPAFTYSVVLNGKIIDSGAYGIANIELQAPANLHTKFSIASISKTFTATAIMLLQQQGKLSLDDPITKYFDSLPETWKNITIRHLLSHTSGIRDNMADFPYPIVDNIDYKTEYTKREIIHKAIDAPMNFKPGERYAYCTTGFQLLGFIIEKISGKELPDFMEENIFRPLGMNETGFFNVRKIVPNRAAGYTIDSDDPNHELRNAHYMGTFFCTMGDCGVITTALDMARWNAALDSGKILGKKILDQMWTPATLSSGAEVNYFGNSYGLGWFLSDYHGYTVIWHSGSLWNGYRSCNLRFDDFHLSIVVLTNSHKAEASKICYKLAGYYNSALKGFDHIDAAGIANPDAIEKINRLMKEIIDDNLDTSLVTINFKRRMNPATRIAMGGPGPDSGPGPSITFLSSEKFENRKVYRYHTPIKSINYYQLKFPDNGIAHLSLYMTADNKIEDWMVF